MSPTASTPSAGIPVKDTFNRLNSTLELVQAHVGAIAVNLGHYEALNEAAGMDISRSARRGAAQLRKPMLSANLVAVAAVFARSNPRYKDNVSFHSYADALRDPAFVQYCAGQTGIYASRAQEEADEFVALLDASSGEYQSIKPMRDKAIAHTSRKAYPRPIINDILELSRRSAAMTRCLWLLFRGTDLDVSTLATGAKMHVLALMRAERSKKAG